MPTPGRLRRCLGTAPWMLAALVAALGGCDDVQDTCDYANDELSISAIVVDNGAKVRAEFDFEVGDRSGAPRPVALCVDESLKIGDKTPMITTKPDRIVYSVTLPADIPREVAFVVQRVGSDPIEVTVPVPPPFEITAPTPSQDIPRSEDLVLEWTPPLPGADMRVSVDEDVGYGLCVVTEEGEHHYKRFGGVVVPDDGMWIVPAGAVTSQTPNACRAYYNLRRVQRAMYPDSLAPGGVLEARVQRTVEIRSIP